MTPPSTASGVLAAWLDDVSAEVARRQGAPMSARRLLTLPLRAPRVIRRRIHEEGLVPTLDLIAAELRRLVRGLVRRVLR